MFSRQQYKILDSVYDFPKIPRVFTIINVNGYLRLLMFMTITYLLAYKKKV